MQIPTPSALLARIEALPAGEPLLAALAGEERVYLVGGTVRDLLLAAAGRGVGADSGDARGGATSGPSRASGTRVGDLDLVAEGDVGALAARLGGVPVHHERFGTTTVKLDGHSYDLARARRETYPAPGALPEVAPAPLSEDLLRRDFTVNALAVALAGPAAGVVLAAPHALEDLGAGRLRVLHDRSFRDDPTRLLRMARYASRLGFEIEPETRALALEAIEAGALATVSGSRLGSELKLLARESDPVDAFGALRELGIDRALDPRFGIADAELARRALALLPADGRRDVVALAVATLGLPTGAAKALLGGLAFEAEIRDGVLAAVLRGRATAEALAAARVPSQVAGAVAGGGPELVAVAGALGPEAAPPARAWLESLRHVRLEIDGADLLAAGVSEGPALGRGLRAALAAKLDGLLSGREAELAEAVRAARM